MRHTHDMAKGVHSINKMPGRNFLIYKQLAMGLLLIIVTGPVNNDLFNSARCIYFRMPAVVQLPVLKLGYVGKQLLSTVCSAKVSPQYTTGLWAYSSISLSTVQYLNIALATV